MRSYRDCFAYGWIVSPVIARSNSDEAICKLEERGDCFAYGSQ